MRFHIYLPAEDVSLASSFHTVSTFSVLHLAKVPVRTVISFLFSSGDLGFRGLCALLCTPGLPLVSGWANKHSSLSPVRDCALFPPHSWPAATDWTAARGIALPPGFKTASESKEKSPSVILMGNRKGFNLWNSAFTPYCHGQSLFCSSQQNTE